MILWPCQQMELSSPSLESIFFSQSIVLTVSSSQVQSNGCRFYLWLWTDAKIGFIVVKHRQILDWNILMTLFLFHFARSFLMPKFSANMWYTALFAMPTMSASSRTFSWRSSNIILWIFFTVPVVVTSFGQPLRSSFPQLVRPRLNFATQYFIVVNKGVDSPRVESSSALQLVGRLQAFNISSIRLVLPTIVIFTNNNRLLYGRMPKSRRVNVPTSVVWLHFLWKIKAWPKQRRNGRVMCVETSTDD